MFGLAKRSVVIFLAILASCAPSSGNDKDDRSHISVESHELVHVNQNTMAPNIVLATNSPPAAMFATTKNAASPSLDLPASSNTTSNEPFPQEVTSYMVERDGCDHFRGEDPYDADRRAYLDESISELCTGTDMRLAVLKQRYAKNATVIAALNAYDENTEEHAPHD